MNWPPSSVDELWAWVKTMYLTNAQVDKISRDSVLPDWPIGADKQPVTAKEFWHKIPAIFARLAEVADNSILTDWDSAYKTAFLCGLGTENASKVRFRVESHFGMSWTFQQLADCLDNIHPRSDSITPQLNALGVDYSGQTGHGKKRPFNDVDGSHPQKRFHLGKSGQSGQKRVKPKPTTGPLHSWKKNNGGSGCFCCGEEGHRVNSCPIMKMSDGEILWHASRLLRQQKLAKRPDVEQKDTAE